MSFELTHQSEAHAAHDHGFGNTEDTFTFNSGKTTTHPLLATNWSDWAPGRIEDGVIDFAIDKTMPGKVKRMVRNVLKEVRGIIDTSVSWKNVNPDTQRCLGKGQRKTDIFITDKDQGESWDLYGNRGPYLDPKYLGASGLAFTTEGCDGIISTATWKTSMYFEQTIVKPNGRIRKFYDFRPATQHVITHEILHTLGLSHPNNSGPEPGFTWTDTAMSYNPGPATGNHITALDAEALQQVWG
mgnify:CR=1 FL=1